MKIQHLMFYEAHEWSDTAKLFHQTADAQRGPPEAKMVELQHLLGGGVFSFAIEHIGDLTHRMTEKFDWFKGHYDIVGDKVDKSLRTLTRSYGFEREMQENFRNNFEYRAGGEYETHATYEEFEQEVLRLSKEYAALHREIPVFNEPQMHARAAAIAMGEYNFRRAIIHLQWLERLLQDVDKYEEEVGKVTMEEGTDNGFFMSKLTGAGPTIYPLPTSAEKYDDIDSKRRGGSKVKVRKRKEK